MKSLQRKSCACGGGCPRCREQSPLRAKFVVGQRGDALEQEADRVAQQVLRMPQPEHRHQPEPHDSAGLRVSRYSHPASAQGSRAIPPIVNDVVRSPGEPLDSPTRAFMEPRFGHDFSKVRVHADSRAAQSAAAVDALAYTVGRDIVFASGWDNGTTAASRRLLAHELAHVLQQERSTPVREVSSGTGLQRQPAPAADDCKGWEADPVSLVTAAAHFYAETVLSPPVNDVVREVKFSRDGKIATAHFAKGLELFVSLHHLPNSIPVTTHGLSNVKGPSCSLTYSCPSGGAIVFTIKSCK